MPINYKDYPENWQEIRQRVLERAQHQCECCGLENYEQVYSMIVNGKTVWTRTIDLGDFVDFKPKTVKVVLTIAHLDHDETNHDVQDDRLKAMCQLCHLRYDAKEKANRRKLKSITK
jgi:hypothetical protein